MVQHELLMLVAARLLVLGKPIVPILISDRGAQFVCGDLQTFLRLRRTTHVLTSLHYPQSNGKLGRFHRTLKEQAIRPKTPLTLDDAQRIVGAFIVHYNTARLHSALGYITPADRLAGRHTAIFQTRDQKPETARETRKLKRQQATALTA